mgnify:CR=1 FL=1|jgi:ribosomal protein S3
MRAKIEQEQRGEWRIKGVVMEMVGRVRGAGRARRKLIKRGRQDQAERYSRITEGRGVVQSKYGTVCIRVQCAIEREQKKKK